MINLTDEYGNIIFEKDASVYLYIHKKDQTRKLGSMSESKSFFVRRYPKHIYRKLNAYGFNLNLLKALNPEMAVVVKQEDDKSQLKTKVKTILQEGKIIDESEEGLEKQIFLSIQNFNS